MAVQELNAAQLRERIVRENPHEHDIVLEIINKWLGRGDGIAVYVNDHPGATLHGESMYVSYGSDQAILTASEAPERLVPDSRYELVATYRGEPLKEEP
jgi:hypothetical protein